MNDKSPAERYAQDLLKPGFVQDPAQAGAVAALQDLYERLVAAEAKKVTPSGRLRRLLGRKKAPQRGLYFWGGVGRGKTYLVDMFFEALPLQRKLRVHFHRFMQRVHTALTQLAGEKNPLQQVADDIAAEAIVICFDEFFVTDIADAMILGGLMEALFERGVSPVATSNIEPCDLYRDGLQRARFLPAIALIEKHTDVINVDSGVDYRLRTLERVELWHSPLDKEASALLRGNFEALANGMAPRAVTLPINHRDLVLEAMIEGMAMIDFAELCHKPRSASDYIEIARIFHTLLLANVTCMGSDKEDAARRFINMVDEFYDRGVKLVVSAEVPPEALYTGNLLAFEYRRTLSRLQEMQSREYLAREHKP